MGVIVIFGASNRPAYRNHAQAVPSFHFLQVVSSELGLVRPMPISKLAQGGSTTSTAWLVSRSDSRPRQRSTLGRILMPRPMIIKADAMTQARKWFVSSAAEGEPYSADHRDIGGFHAESTQGYTPQQHRQTRI